MEEKKEPKFICLPSTAISHLNSNVASSFTALDNDASTEYQVIVLDDNVSFDLNDVITFIDEDGNPITLRHPEQDLVVEINDNNDIEDKTDLQTNSPSEPDSNVSENFSTSTENKICAQNSLVTVSSEAELLESSKENEQEAILINSHESFNQDSNTSSVNEFKKSTFTDTQLSESVIINLREDIVYPPESLNLLTETEHPSENSNLLTETEYPPENSNLLTDTEHPPENSNLLTETEHPPENSNLLSETEHPLESSNADLLTELSQISNGNLLSETEMHDSSKSDGNLLTDTEHQGSSNENECSTVSQMKPISILKQNCIEVVTSQESSNNSTALSAYVEPMQLGPEPESWSCADADVVVVDGSTCPLCNKRMKCYKNVKKHVLRFHKRVPTSKMGNIPGLFIKCLECNRNYNLLQKLRDHLRIVHHLKMECQELSFPNMNAFLTWKHEIERKDLYFFKVKRRVKAVVPKVFYVCNRSGKYENYLVSKPRKAICRSGGTFKMGIQCTATIYIEDRPNEVYVKYWPHHYGHGKDSPAVKMATTGPNAIMENASFTNGIPFEELLEDIREKMGTDYHQLSLVKRKDLKFIRNAFAAQEYSEGMSDAESVDRWVHLCSQMEDSPILYYRNEENPDIEFMLVIMTEFQKHILMSSDRKVLSIDALHRRKKSRYYFNCLCVVDENDIAYPVAYSISDKLDKTVLKIFLEAVKESTGPLSCSYLMSDWDKFYFEAWVETMNDDCKWLWSIWNMDTRIGSKLHCFKPHVPKRAEAYRTMRMLMECKDRDVFDTMYQKYLDWLMEDPISQKFGKFVIKRYGRNKELWANCYHDIKTSTVISLEMLYRALRYCCVEGKDARMDKFIFVIMKLLRHKMLLHLTNMLDDEKTGLAIDAIDMCHQMGLEVTTDRISSLSDKIWMICSDGEEEDVYITREFDSCPEHCKLRCAECDICVHMYSCSCTHNMINANLCQHIHAIVYKFLTPQFSPMNSPARDDDIDELEHMEVSDVPGESSVILMENVMKRTHDVYKKVRSSKQNLTQESLNDLMEHLNECLKICSGNYVKVKKPEMSDGSCQTLPITINPFVNGPQQPFVLTNGFPNVLPQNQFSQYVVLLQDGLNNGAFVQK